MWSPLSVVSSGACICVHALLDTSVTHSSTPFLHCAGLLAVLDVEVGACEGRLPTTSTPASIIMIISITIQDTRLSTPPAHTSHTRAHVHRTQHPYNEQLMTDQEDFVAVRQRLQVRPRKREERRGREGGPSCFPLLLMMHPRCA